MSDDKFTLLVVDDNEDNRDMLSRRLLRKNFEVLVAEGGPQALALVASSKIDLVLLDIMMPGMSGLDVLRELRKAHTQDSLPILMVTAKNESEDIVEALELGANDYVSKPIDFPVVLARLQVHLRNKIPKKNQVAPAPTVIIPGTILEKKYLLEKKIGAGGFGVVYRAMHLELRRPVAIKILLNNLLSDPSAIARFKAEGVTMGRVQHPNAVSVSDFGATEDGVAFLVMELLEGRSLESEMGRNTFVPLARANEIISPVCDALANAHQHGVIHRDIKPSNIFLHQTPQGEVPKVLDFGLAKLITEDLLQSQKTADGYILGTMSHIAPERLSSQTYTGSVDVYSIGCILYEMFCGRLPFTVEGSDPIALAMKHLNEKPIPPRDFNPLIDPDVEALVVRSLSKIPPLRPTAKELAARLRVLAGRASQPRIPRVISVPKVPSYQPLDIALSDTQESPAQQDILLELSPEMVLEE